VADAARGEPSVPVVLGRAGLRALPVHRLDRDVSGVLLLARDEESRDALQQLFRGRELTKVYWALAVGWLEPPDGQLTYPILEEQQGARVSARGKPARTLYRTPERCSTRASGRGAPLQTCELELELVTGRRNQIRVHLAHAGHP
jgi:23S rRNA-/tRNA-specific pseudouridylate synthase